MAAATQEVPDLTLVRMRHPKIEHPEDKPLPVTTVHAFENVHAKKGWQLIDEPVTGVDLENMTKVELREEYASATEHLPESATKADLIDAIRATQEV